MSSKSTPKVCSVEGCDRRMHGRGWCAYHYNLWYYGTNQSNLRGTFEERFWSRVQKSEEGCWLWTAGADRDGYGTIKRNGRMSYAHRVSYEMHFGPIEKGLCVCHSCDTPACVRPDHLWLGTNRDNTLDRHAKGRSAQGERNGFSRLSDDDVRAIREKYDQGGVSMAQLARDHNVSAGTVWLILNRVHWKHV